MAQINRALPSDGLALGSVGNDSVNEYSRQELYHSGGRREVWTRAEAGEFAQEVPSVQNKVAALRERENGAEQP